MKLDGKLLLLFALAALLFARVLGASTRRGVHSAFISNFENSVAARAPEISASLSVGLAPGNEEILAEYLSGSLPGFGASYAAGLRPDGAVAGRVGLDPSQDRATREIDWRRVSSTESGPRLLEVVVPVTARGKRLGALLLGFSLEETLKTEEAVNRKIFWFAGASGGLSMLLLLVLTRVMLAPIRELSEGFERIIQGRFGTMVPVRSGDEIGELAGRFNAMSRELVETTVSKDYLAGILAHLPDGVFVADPDGILRSANPALRGLAGCGEAELTGRHAWTLFAGSDNPFSGPALGRLASGSALNNVSARLLSKAGGEVPVLLSAALLRDAHGAAAGIIGSAKDMTAVKRKDEELRKKEQQLFQSEKLSAVGQLAAGIAHEINNPLGSILGFAQAALRKAGASEPLLYPLRCIEEEALRCRRLVSNLLTFSRKGRGELSEFDLNDAVERSLVMVQAQARVRGIEIVREFGKETIMSGDRNQIEQVVVNLCCNAIDAMPGGGRLILRTRRPLQAGEGAVWLEVQDTGPGIPEEIQGRIFEPFFTTKAVGEGTGLGLSLAHEIVARHGGEIDVRNVAGRGALFRVLLPRALKR